MASGPFSDDHMMSEINVTPLVDVMLVLLVVFIVTAPLLAPQALKINLPKTQAVAQSDPPRPVRLSIDAQGGLAFEQSHLSDAGLSETLKQRAADPLFQLQIEADTAVAYGRVAQVMAIAQQAGVSRLAFLTQATP